jgi:hypothetical protein
MPKVRSSNIEFATDIPDRHGRHAGEDAVGLSGRVVLPLIGDDRLKKVDDLLLSGGHNVELPAHLGEAVVDMRT